MHNENVMIALILCAFVLLVRGAGAARGESGAQGKDAVQGEGTGIEAKSKEPSDTSITHDTASIRNNDSAAQRGNSAWGNLWRLCVAAVLIGAATALKATAIIALPFAVWLVVLRCSGEHGVARGQGVSAVQSVGVAGDVAGGDVQGVARAQSSLRSVFSHSVLFTESVPRLRAVLWSAPLAGILALATIALITWLSGQTWGWVSQLTGNTKVINPLAAPSFIASTLYTLLSPFIPDLTFNALVDGVRPVCTVVMLVGLVIVGWLFRTDERTVLAGMSLAYLVTCVFNAVTLPWYYTPAVALAGLWVRGSRGTVVVTSFLMWLALMFDGGGNNRLYVLWWVVGCAALAVCFALAALPKQASAKTVPATSPNPSPNKVHKATAG